MNHIEAMRQALDALENPWESGPNGVASAITALRTAIKAAEKQEPYGYFRYDMRLDAWVQSREDNRGVAFYTTPPAAQRQWVGLTEEEMKLLWAEYGYRSAMCKPFTRAIEAKLKEKNAAAQPAQRQPLTEDQIDDIWNRYCDEMGEASINDAYDIARAVEAAHDITGEKT